MGMCVWERDEIPEISEWCNLINSSNIDLDEVIPAGSQQLKEELESLIQRFPKSSHQSSILDDLYRLLGAFSDLTQAKNLRIRFGVVRTDECRKFHVDAVKIRLFCTYQGPGTEWIRDQDLVLENLGNTFSCVEEYNTAILKPNQRVQSLAAFHVAFAKGSCWPGTDWGGVVHRSPPLETLGLCRVRLIVEEQ